MNVKHEMSDALVQELVIEIAKDDYIAEVEKELKKYIEDNKLNWLNMLEPDNGKSTILSKYYVEETPMLFLLDKDLKIISRPANVKQLDVKLKKLLK